MKTQDLNREEIHMRTRVFCVGAAVGLLALCGCATSPVAYRSEVSIARGAQANEYLVSFKIRETGRAGETAQVWAPSLIVVGAREGTISVLQDGTRDGIVCKALVTEDAGSLTAATSVTVRRKGTDIWASNQTTTVAPK